MSGRLVAAALAVALVLGACGKDDGLPTAPVEKDIQRGLTRQTRVKVDSVTCPDNVKPEKGNAFVCTARYAGGETARVVVSQRDANGNVTWRLAAR